VDLLRRVAATARATRWFAFGGIDDDADDGGRATRLDQVLEAGATRIVVVRAVTEAEDPEKAAARLRRRLAD
jgi:thiamine-phosphate pyrophosphorylase